MHKIPITPEGKKKLETRLKHLKAVERPKIIRAIEEARGHGDLSENAEYHAAKEAQAHLAREMREIEDKLARAQVIDPQNFNHAKITFGASVTLEETETGEEKIYQIVGPDESDVKAGKISVVSPIAKALIGKEKGAFVTVATPKGPKEFEVLAIAFKSNRQNIDGVGVKIAGAFLFSTPPKHPENFKITEIQRLLILSSRVPFGTPFAHKWTRRVLMGFLKAVSFITLWVLLSFFWVSMGQGQSSVCPGYSQVDIWLKSYPVLKGWFHFYVGRQNCEVSEEEFFKTLASSEPLSIKLNQAKVTFEQFYVPLYHVLSVSDWKKIEQEESQKIQSDLNLIDHSLTKALGAMNAADQDYFRAVVLLDLPSEFVRNQNGKEARGITDLSRRLNRTRETSRSQMDNKDIASPPYERVFAIDK